MGRRIILHQVLMEVIGRCTNHTPKIYRYAMIRELENFKLINRLDQRKYMIIGGNLDAKLQKYNHLFFN